MVFEHIQTVKGCIFLNIQNFSSKINEHFDLSLSQFLIRNTNTCCLAQKIGVKVYKYSETSKYGSGVNGEKPVSKWMLFTEKGFNGKQ